MKNVQIIRFIKGFNLPVLSICIPTFNRAKYLAELLDSIVEHGAPDIEVIVSDDASTDNTADVVVSYKSRLQHLKYIRQAKNIGLDRNFLAVVDNASGDFVWFLGDDDRLAPGAVKKVLAALADWPGIAGMTVGVIDYDHDFRAPTGLRYMPPTARLSGAEAVFGTIVELLGFMSALIVDRRMWGIVCREDPIHDYENLYIQVYILGRMIQRFGDWGILNTPCVGFRTSNDQFLGKLGWLKRMKADVIAYEQIAEGLFAQNPDIRHAIRERVFATHVLARIRNAKTSDGPTPEIWGAVKLLYSHYKQLPVFWYSALPTLLMPKWLLRKIRVAYQRYSSSSGAGRAKAIGARQ